MDVVRSELTIRGCDGQVRNSGEEGRRTSAKGEHVGEAGELRVAHQEHVVSGRRAGAKPRREAKRSDRPVLFHLPSPPCKRKRTFQPNAACCVFPSLVVIVSWFLCWLLSAELEAGEQRVARLHDRPRLTVLLLPQHETHKRRRLSSAISTCSHCFFCLKRPAKPPKHIFVHVVPIATTDTIVEFSQPNTHRHT